MVLSGWSDGPLHHVLQTPLAHGVTKLHATVVDIPMPPSGCLWLKNPYLLAIVGWLFGCTKLIPFFLNAVGFETKTSRLFGGVACTVAAVWITWRIIKHLIDYAVSDGVARARKAINEIQPDLVIGFSWGGAVLYWLLEQPATWEGGALLLAPTVTKLASLSGRPIRGFAKTGAPNSGIDGSVATAGMGTKTQNIIIIQGNDDPFCEPAQLTWFESQAKELEGMQVVGVEDNHVLMQHHTLQLAREAVARLLVANS